MQRKETARASREREEKARHAREARANTPGKFHGKISFGALKSAASSETPPQPQTARRGNERTRERVTMEEISLNEAKGARTHRSCLHNSDDCGGDRGHGRGRGSTVQRGWSSVRAASKFLLVSLPISHRSSCHHLSTKIVRDDPLPPLM